MTENNEMRFGRWIVTDDSIETKKINNAVISIDKDCLWDHETEGNDHYFLHPVDLCCYLWLSNTDILDFNSAFLVALEKFSEFKPKNLPSLTWTLTLARQYERINRSLDINSHEGKIKWEQMQNYFAKESIENKIELFRFKHNDDYLNHKEIVGDKNSRVP